MFAAIGKFCWSVITFPARVVAWLTLPARVAWLLWLFLIICVIAVYITFLYDPYRVPWQHSLTWTRGLVIFALTVVIPIVSYYTLRLWLEGEISPFPDIDYAWRAGIEELRKNGLEVNQIPVFLVLGSSSEERNKALMNASDLSFRVREIPHGPAPLHWYANPDGVYIVLTDTGALSALAALGDAPATHAALSKSPEAAPTMGDSGLKLGGKPVPVPKLAAAARTTPQPAAPPPKGNVRGTMVLSALGSDPDGGPASLGGPSPRGPEPRAPIAPRGPAPGEPPSRAGTMVLRPAEMESIQGGGMNPGMALQPSIQRPGAGGSRSSDVLMPLGDTGSLAAAGLDWSGAESGMGEARHISLSGPEAAEQTRRLEYVSYLLKKARLPLCPVNGMLALLPLSVIRLGPREAVEVQRALKNDLNTIRRILQVRCPVTTLVVGFEAEPGFRELVRRVGQDRAAVQRFGKGFELWVRPTATQIEAFCSHACNAFESWIYALFRERGALSKPGNTRLYMLLVQVRRTLQSRLASILASGFSDPAGEDPNADPMLFGGCYFAAVGDKGDRQAFVKGVFDKLAEQQEDVEWTRLAWRRERIQLRWAYILIISDVIMGVTLIGLISWKLMYG